MRYGFSQGAYIERATKAASTGVDVRHCTLMRLESLTTAARPSDAQHPLSATGLDGIRTAAPCQPAAASFLEPDFFGH